MRKSSYQVELETMADALKQKQSSLYDGVDRLLECWADQTDSIEDEYIIPLCTIVHERFENGSETLHDVFILPGSDSLHFISYPNYLSPTEGSRDYYILEPSRTGSDSISPSNLRKVIAAFPGAMRQLRELVRADIDIAFCASDSLRALLEKF